MTVYSLIEKLEALQVRSFSGSNWRSAPMLEREDVLTIVRRHQAEQPRNVIERVAKAISGRILPKHADYEAARRAIAAMSEAQREFYAGESLGSDTGVQQRDRCDVGSSPIAVSHLGSSPAPIMGDAGKPIGTPDAETTDSVCAPSPATNTATHLQAVKEALERAAACVPLGYGYLAQIEHALTNHLPALERALGLTTEKGTV